MACQGLAEALVAEGAEVTFVLPFKSRVSSPGVRFVFAEDYDPGLRTLAESGAYHAYSTSGTSSTISHSLRTRFPEIARWGLFDQVVRYGAIARMIAEDEPHDIIHAHDWLSFLAGMEAKAAAGRPLVAHVHATEYDRTGHGSINTAVHAIEKRGMHAADEVVAVSHYTKQLLVERYAVLPERISVLHNAINPDDPSIIKETLSTLHALKAAGHPIVLFVGRLTLQKGPDYFLRTAARVLAYEPKTIFVISGDGDMRTQLMQLAAYLGIADRVLFVGFLRGRELGTLYKTADLLVMPSVSEPFGIVPLESMLNGTPVLISKQSGVAEVVRHALRVDFWDVEEMTNQILSIIRYPALRETLAEHGYREVAGRVWRKVAAQCMLIYEKVRALWEGARNG